MFACVHCRKTFQYKSRFETHKKRKTPCGNQLVLDIQPPNKIVKPLLKWVGGKTQLLDELLSKFPTKINNYHEIFMGGGSVLLAVLQYAQQNIIHIRGKVYAYDINEPLIEFYKNVQTRPRELYDEIQRIMAEYDHYREDAPPLYREKYYYNARAEYNSLSDKTTVKCSALFLFLNKTCFRGMYRVGPHGFNVPVGNYKNVEVINLGHLNEVHRLIQNVEFKCCDFTESLPRVNQTDDYMYLDPPYAPLNATSFVGYTEGGFDTSRHTILFGLLGGTNKKFMMSNADVDFVHEHFREAKYNIETVSCRRAINAKNPDARANEVIIRNY